MECRLLDSVLLVHGTFASGHEDDGVRWWQRGGRFRDWLNSELDGVGFCRDVFRWSGRNLERDRRQAGRELLEERLRIYERDKVPYHLVGHSHGGSVIWTALCQAALEAKPGEDPLPHLRSWTTVGTPFFSYGVQRWELFYILPLAGSGFVLLSVLGMLSLAVRHSAVLAERGLWQTVMEVGGLAALAIMLLGVFWVAFTRIVSFTRACLSSARDQAAARRAAKAFGNRWLGLWSREDEAINGLRSSLHLGDLRRDGRSVRILPLRVPLIGPLGDRIFFNWLKSIVQGNDQPGRRLIAVSWAPPHCSVPPEPDPSLHVRLLEQVAGDSQGIRVTLDRIRRLLGDVAFGGDLPTPFSPEPGQVPLYNTLLVHTLYLHESQASSEPQSIGGRIVAFIRFRSRAGTDTASVPANSEAVALTFDSAGVELEGPAPAPADLSRPTEVSPVAVSGPSRNQGPFDAPIPIVQPESAARLPRVSPVVPLLFALGLLLASVPIGLAAGWVYERVRPSMLEAQVVRMIGDSERIVADAAVDNENFQAVADWSEALARVSDRTANLRVTPAGPLAFAESWHVPGITLTREDALASLEKIDEPWIRARMLSEVAESLATSDPPRFDLAGLYADQAHKSVSSFRIDLPGNAAPTLVRIAQTRARIGQADLARENALDAIRVALGVLNDPDSPIGRPETQQGAPGKASTLAPTGPRAHLARLARRAGVKVSASPPASTRRLVGGSGRVVTTPQNPGSSQPAPFSPLVQFISAGDLDPGSAPSKVDMRLAVLRAAELLDELGYREETRDAVRDLIRLSIVSSPNEPSHPYTCSVTEGIRLARLIRKLGLEDQYSGFRNCFSKSLLVESSAKQWSQALHGILEFGEEAAVVMRELGLTDQIVSSVSKRVESYLQLDAINLTLSTRVLHRLGRPESAAKAALATLARVGISPILPMPADDVPAGRLMDVPASRLMEDEKPPAPQPRNENNLPDPPRVDEKVTPSPSLPGDETPGFSSHERASTVDFAIHREKRIQSVHSRFLDPKFRSVPRSASLRQMKSPRTRKISQASYDVFMPPTPLEGLDSQRLKKVFVSLWLARLDLGGDPLPEPAQLVKMAWEAAEGIGRRATGRPVEMIPPAGKSLAIPGRGQRGVESLPDFENDLIDPASQPDPIRTLFDGSRSAALAEVIGVAATLRSAEAPAIRKSVLESYRRLASNPTAGLKAEAGRSEPLCRALRRLSATFALEGDAEEALAIAREISIPTHRLSARLFVALQLARGHTADRVEARRIAEAAEEEISRTISRRRDRSPRFAVCSTVWALLGEMDRAMKAREECRFADRLHADAAILRLFATSRGEPPPILPPFGWPIPIFQEVPPNTQPSAATPTSIGEPSYQQSLDMPG